MVTINLSEVILLIFIFIAMCSFGVVIFKIAYEAYRDKYISVRDRIVIRRKMTRKSKPIIKDELYCRECGSKRILVGEYIKGCKECGNVLLIEQKERDVI